MWTRDRTDKVVHFVSKKHSFLFSIGDEIDNVTWHAE